MTTNSTLKFYVGTHHLPSASNSEIVSTYKSVSVAMTKTPEGTIRRQILTAVFDLLPVNMIFDNIVFTVSDLHVALPQQNIFVRLVQNEKRLFALSYDKPEVGFSERPLMDFAIQCEAMLVERWNNSVSRSDAAQSDHVTDFTARCFFLEARAKQEMLAARHLTPNGPFNGKQKLAADIKDSLKEICSMILLSSSRDIATTGEINQEKLNAKMAEITACVQISDELTKDLGMD